MSKREWMLVESYYGKGKVADNEGNFICECLYSIQELRQYIDRTIPSGLAKLEGTINNKSFPIGQMNILILENGKKVHFWQKSSLGEIVFTGGFE